MTRRLSVTCALCPWTITGPTITCEMEARIRKHMEDAHAEELPPAGFGGRPLLRDVLRHFRVETAHAAGGRRST